MPITIGSIFRQIVKVLKTQDRCGILCKKNDFYKKLFGFCSNTCF